MYHSNTNSSSMKRKRQLRLLCLDVEVQFKTPEAGHGTAYTTTSSLVIYGTASTTTHVRQKRTQYTENAKVSVDERKVECLTYSCKRDIKNSTFSLHKDTHGSVGPTKAQIGRTLPSRTCWISNNVIRPTTNWLDKSNSNLTIFFRSHQLLWASIDPKFDFGHTPENRT